MSRVVITGAAGLVGQNLIARLRARGDTDIVAIDKHPTNTATLRTLHPGLEVIEADMAEPGPWTRALDGADAVVIGQAQIGGLGEDEFRRNNIVATRHLLEALADRPELHLVHISSSVVNSAASDFYTRSKTEQEALVLAAGHPTLVVRPTLMFGWFDRKHLGWLARFMQRAPVFPVPGSGQYVRQPLYVGDFCGVLMAGLDRRMTGAYNISGQEYIAYIDLMRLVREAVCAKAPVVRIPYGLFRGMLAAYALVDRNPPFTTKQLEALVTPDVFEVIDWPGLFGVPATKLRDAVMETFRDTRYASVELAF